MPRLMPPAPRGQAGLLALLLLLLAGRAALAQRWHNEDYERPIDQEGSGDDDSFEDEEIEETDEIYSGSGSGYFEQESRIKTAVRLTTDPSIGLSTTPAVLPVTSVQPVATPFAPFPTEETTYDPSTSGLYVTRATEAPAVTIWKAVTTTAGTSIRDTTTATTTASTTTASTTTAASKATTVPRVLPPFITIVATTQAVALETPTVVTAAPSTESTTAPPVTTSLTKIRGMPKPSPSQHPDITLLLPTTTASESTQTEPPDVTLSTALNNELEVPVSGDFEIHEEEEDTTRTELGNEVVAVVTPAAGPGLKKNVEPGLIDNTIDSGNSAAQLPQKNILERKEVLIAVIVGGVVGALFAAFLVMLLIYRMKKKDEGSYTLEEPKQASVTYQKPDKQEEFYA
ncbi:syndecan-3 [Heteronotia binoei]|uniref:syndecan-3 n=1 Tax=Heteronotia binoei TaxID=13085 RepID=UPI00292D0AAA|nr:syndecan-3 [Heteronotia binoei]